VKFFSFFFLQEVAVKKFLDQDFYGDALDEFRSEVGEPLSVYFLCFANIVPFSNLVSSL
jgi:hypothetical protein